VEGPKASDYTNGSFLLGKKRGIPYEFPEVHFTDHLAFWMISKMDDSCDQGASVAGQQARLEDRDKQIRISLKFLY